MDYEETTRVLLLRLWDEDVGISIWERQPDGLTFTGNRPPMVVRLAADTVALDPTAFVAGEWRDDPEPGSLWILRNDQAIVLSPSVG